MSSDVVLFIDANQYLSLYGLTSGNRLLDSLEEQKSHIFVSAQIVDEVNRNKLRCAATFLSDKMRDIDQIRILLPDHLLGISASKRAEFVKIFGDVLRAKTELSTLADAALSRISRSEDEVSQRLMGLFVQAPAPSGDEMQRARARKERGNPPGKPTDPLGDQITWEQLLTHSKGSKRLWIISNHYAM